MHTLIFNLLLVFLPTQIGYHFWPVWSMVLGRRVDYLSPTLYVTDVLIFFLLLFKFPTIRITKITAGVVLFIGLNIFFAASPWVAAYKWLKVLEYVFLALYIKETKPKLSSVTPLLSIGVLYSSLLAIGQFLLQHSIGFWILGERTFTNQTPGIAQFYFGELLLRPYATFPHPNVLGGFLAIMIPLMLTQWKNNKMLYSISIAAGMLALGFTWSRSAWIAALLGLVILTLKKKYFIPLFVVATVIIFFIFNSFGLQDESVVVRQQLNNSAITLFQESPIIGKGLGNFLVTLPDHLESREIYFLQPVHNIYVLLLSETGIIGFALFIWILWKARKFWITFIIFVLGLVDHYFLTLQQGQLLLTLFLSLAIYNTTYGKR